MRCSFSARRRARDPDPAERSIARLNADLHELLARAGEKPAYVLIGHSLGGMLVRKYAKRYPQEVTAMVLVDSYPRRATSRPKRGTGT